MHPYDVPPGAPRRPYPSRSASHATGPTATGSREASEGVGRQRVVMAPAASPERSGRVAHDRHPYAPGALGLFRHHFGRSSGGASSSATSEADRELHDRRMWTSFEVPGGGPLRGASLPPGPPRRLLSPALEDFGLNSSATEDPSLGTGCGGDGLDAALFEMLAELEADCRAALLVREQEVRTWLRNRSVLVTSEAALRRAHVLAEARCRAAIAHDTVQHLDRVLFHTLAASSGRSIPPTPPLALAPGSHEDGDGRRSLLQEPLLRLPMSVREAALVGATPGPQYLFGWTVDAAASRLARIQRTYTVHGAPSSPATPVSAVPAPVLAGGDATVERARPTHALADANTPASVQLFSDDFKSCISASPYTPYHTYADDSAMQQDVAAALSMANDQEADPPAVEAVSPPAEVSSGSSASASYRGIPFTDDPIGSGDVGAALPGVDADDDGAPPSMRPSTGVGPSLVSSPREVSAAAAPRQTSSVNAVVRPTMRLAHPSVSNASFRVASPGPQFSILQALSDKPKQRDPSSPLPTLYTTSYFTQN